MNVVNNVKVYGLEESIKRAKYPMSVDPWSLDSNLTQGIKNLAKSDIGSGHDQFLTGIIVQFDLTFTIKAWTEAERYHFFDFVSSQSTMHRITKMDLDNAYNGHVDPRIIKIMKEKVAAYNECEDEKIKAIRYLDVSLKRIKFFVNIDEFKYFTYSWRIEEYIIPRMKEIK